MSKLEQKIEYLTGITEDLLRAVAIVIDNQNKIMALRTGSASHYDESEVSKFIEETLKGLE